MSNAIGGLSKLTKENLKELLGLLDIDSNAFEFENKTAMAEYLYNKIVAMVKSNKKLKQKVEELQLEIENMQDCYRFHGSLN